MKYRSASIEETHEIAREIASNSEGGDVYGLTGELGAGKTEFVKGFVSLFNRDAVVRSPSFSLVNIYDAGKNKIYHFDFYRLGSGSELDDIGFEEYLWGRGICIIEWADMFQDIMPDITRYINISRTGMYERAVEISG